MSNDIYQRLMDITATFVELIQQETAFLEAHDVPSAQTLLPEKQRLAEIHQQVCQEFNAQNRMAQCTVEELQALKETIEVMRTSLVENKEALDIAHKVRSHIINKISQAVKENQAPTCHYNKAARFHANSSPVSMLALDRQI
ncbi:hypothetical protein [Candidatus Odyssella acanthamoebae]|uniref:Flagellar protein FlgN n=1 Tax=Candidatus Odyssella acanthamoebae TaxID=91604 RepID=A0A077B005_9PROT|nr:hypothetical protein [Candidatus Paracaedibacter acanthamoebae]AIK97288.1 hypothetical protein ID47_11905 [Candidatus Paracaedibacter acanthamoebae]